MKVNVADLKCNNSNNIDIIITRANPAKPDNKFSYTYFHIQKLALVMVIILFRKVGGIL